MLVSNNMGCLYPRNNMPSLENYLHKFKTHTSLALAKLMLLTSVLSSTETAEAQVGDVPNPLVDTLPMTGMDTWLRLVVDTINDLPLESNNTNLPGMFAPIDPQEESSLATLPIMHQTQSETHSRIYVTSLNNQTLNLRSGAGTSYAVVGTLKPDQRLELIDESGDWYTVRIEDGDTAYVAGWLVKTIEETFVIDDEPDMQSVANNDTSNVDETEITVADGLDITTIAEAFDGAQTFEVNGVLFPETVPFYNRLNTQTISVNQESVIYDMDGQPLSIGVYESPPNIDPDLLFQYGERLINGEQVKIRYVVGVVCYIVDGEGKMYLTTMGESGVVGTVFLHDVAYNLEGVDVSGQVVTPQSGSFDYQTLYRDNVLYGYDGNPTVQSGDMVLVAVLENVDISNFGRQFITESNQGQSITAILQNPYGDGEPNNQNLMGVGLIYRAS